MNTSMGQINCNYLLTVSPWTQGKINRQLHELELINLDWATVANADRHTYIHIETDSLRIQWIDWPTTDEQTDSNIQTHTHTYRQTEEKLD